MSHFPITFSSHHLTPPGTGFKRQLVSNKHDIRLSKPLPAPRTNQRYQQIPWSVVLIPISLGREPCLGSTNVFKPDITRAIDRRSHGVTRTKGKKRFTSIFFYLKILVVIEDFGFHEAGQQ